MAFHPNREAQKVERLFSSIHDVRIGFVEAKAKSVEYVTHHVQRFVYIFSAHHDKIIRVAHKVRLQFALQVPPLPYPVENVQVAVRRPGRDPGRLLVEADAGQHQWFTVSGFGFQEGLIGADGWHRRPEFGPKNIC